MPVVRVTSTDRAQLNPFNFIGYSWTGFQFDHVWKPRLGLVEVDILEHTDITFGVLQRLGTADAEI